MRDGTNQPPAKGDDAAAVQAATAEVKKDAVAAVQAVPDEVKKDAAAAAVQAAPDELKKDVTAAAVQAAPEEKKKDVAAAAVEAVIAAKDSEHAALEETVARAVRKELRGQPLVNYEGWLGIYAFAEDGDVLEISEDRSVSMRHGGHYSLVLKIGDDVDAGLTLPLRISGGVDAERVDFSVMLSGDELGLRWPPQLVTVQKVGGSASASFPLEARWDEPRRLWLRVAQSGQFIQHVELTVLTSGAGATDVSTPN